MSEQRAPSIVWADISLSCNPFKGLFYAFWNVSEIACIGGKNPIRVTDISCLII